MGKLALEITKEPIIGNAGLAAMGERMRISDIDSTCAKRESPNYQVAEKDILRCLGGLIGIGKAGFDHVRQFKNSDFFATALGIDRVPSEVTLWQRFETTSLDHDVHDAMPMCSVRMLRKLDFKPRHVSVPHFVGVRIDRTPPSSTTATPRRRASPRTTTRFSATPRSTRFSKEV